MVAHIVTARSSWRRQIQGKLLPGSFLLTATLSYSVKVRDPDEGPNRTLLCDCDGWFVSRALLHLRCRGRPRCPAPHPRSRTAAGWRSPPATAQGPAQPPWPWRCAPQCWCPWPPSSSFIYSCVLYRVIKRSCLIVDTSELWEPLKPFVRAWNPLFLTQCSKTEWVTDIRKLGNKFLVTRQNV